MKENNLDGVKYLAHPTRFVHRTRAIEGLEGPAVFISKIEERKKNKFLVVPPRELLLQELRAKVNYFLLVFFESFFDFGNIQLRTIISKLMKLSTKSEKSFTLGIKIESIKRIAFFFY